MTKRERKHGLGKLCNVSRFESFTFFKDSKRKSIQNSIHKYTSKYTGVMYCDVASVLI